MKKFFGEFKAFISRGNVIDMAIGVIIGAAFGAITSSLVTNIITPFIAWIFNTPNTDALNLTVREATAESEAIVIGFGTFLGTVINFLVIAFVLFLIIKAVNKADELAKKALHLKQEEEAAAAEAKPTTEELLTAILEEIKTQKQ
ncbi:MAG: large conductance mechanosensitive channel protein MscL [Dehalococcoidales bacterium]|nr:large conductance mechanosensitive channel protein MscL [Dehalococcoidales bacterium]